MAFKKVNEKTPFTKAVIKMVLQVPEGCVATYGQIAKVSGRAGAARGVAWILHSCSKKYKLPWHRIVNAQGKISFDRSTHEYKNQKRLLLKERIVFSEAGVINLKKFQWAKKATSKSRPSTKKTVRSQPQMFGKSHDI